MKKNILKIVFTFLFFGLIGCSEDKVDKDLISFLQNNDTQIVITNKLIKSELVKSKYDLYIQEKTKGKIFCSYIISGVGTINISSSEKEVFLYANCSNFLLNGKKVKRNGDKILGGWSKPLVVNIQKVKNNYKILEYKIPRGGPFLEKDRQQIFSGESFKYSRRDILSTNQRLDLEKRNLEQAKKYFKIQ